MNTDQRRALALIAGSQLLALTLWFSASAVAPQLEELWNLSSGQTAGLTLAVQIGFVVGALGLAVSNLADTVASRTLFSVAAVVGASANLALIGLGEGDFLLALLLRFVTGAALAGVYPSGLK
ncbi:MAG: MFS transporter, partial [Acidimicrobiia bacterium]